MRNGARASVLILIFFIIALILTLIFMFDFQKLEVYKKAKLFYKGVLILLNGNDFNRIVRDQLTRATFSIILNIAEGSGRFSKADRRHFFVIARSSAFECVAILDVMKDEGKIPDEQFDHFQQKADELSRMLYAMIKNLGK